MHGRLRARPGAVGARRHPARLQRQAPGARHAALRADHGGRHPARPGDGRRRGQPGHQRPRGASRPTTSSSSASREVRGFFVAAGFSRARDRRRGRDRAPDGVAGSSTASRSSTCGRWTSGGSGRPTGSQAYTLARSIENYATYYDIHYPNEERQAGRPLRTSPTYEMLARLGAAFGEKSGWERPNWFESERDAGRRRERLRPRGWAGMHWSPAIGAEALATRRAAGLFDETSFAKLEVVGPGATAFLGRMCANDVDRPVGSIVYTQLLNRRGGIEADLTVTRTGAGPLPDRHRHRRSATTTRRGCGSTSRTTARSRCAT